MTPVRSFLRRAAPHQVVALAALLALGACAGIPSSSPVTQVADEGGLGQSTVRYTPARPAPGASPQQIIRGYLDAMLAYPVSSATASEFLTPEGRRGWSPSAGVRVYSTTSLGDATVSSREDADTVGKTQAPVEIGLDLTEDARLDRQGHYERRGGPSRLTYTLERVKGEWRIANPQAGVLVNRKFFDDYFRPFNIYFFDRPGNRVVPDPIMVAVGDQLATGLVTSLVRGPGPGAQGAVRTYVPPLDALRPSVPVSEDGVADVEFDTDFSALSEPDRDHLSAQVVWTLRQVPEVEAIRLVGGTTVLADRDRGVQDVDSWGGYGPSFARGRAYAIAGGRVVQVDGVDVSRVGGAWGKDARGAVSLDVASSGVAGVLRGRALVRVTDRKGGRARTIAGSRLAPPRWDPDGNLWILDHAEGRTRVRILSRSAVRALHVGRLAGLDATTLALSPDGSRYAVTVPRPGGATIRVGRVLRDAKDRIVGLGDPGVVHTEVRSPRSVTWTSSTEVTYLGDSRAGRQVYTTRIDGSSTTGGVSRGGALLPDVDAEVLAIGPGETPVSYVTDARRRLWFLSPGGSWQLLKTTGVTGLTYGR
jgi:hypothetical protein